jgi:hypothetical protein
MSATHKGIDYYINIFSLLYFRRIFRFSSLGYLTHPNVNRRRHPGGLSANRNLLPKSYIVTLLNYCKARPISFPRYNLYFFSQVVRRFSSVS